MPPNRKTDQPDRGPACKSGPAWRGHFLLRGNGAIVTRMLRRVFWTSAGEPCPPGMLSLVLALRCVVLLAAQLGSSKAAGQRQESRKEAE